MSIRQVCRTLSLSRSVYFSRPNIRRDEPVIPVLTGMAEHYPRYGFKELFQVLRRPTPLATPEALNQSWSSYFMHNTLTWSRRFRTFNAVDDFNREALTIEIDLNISALRVIRMLDRTVANREYPLKMQMYNEPELISLALAQWAEDQGVMLEFIKPGKPTQNVFIERLKRTYRTEILDFYLCRTLNEA